ncbi:MAG: hypothetical protein HZB26_07720 [Candidatus Hydrogenedentes bacterium]|nr:hypothetical protein [Candidatus Hydrogenedentota bacterium]
MIIGFNFTRGRRIAEFDCIGWSLSRKDSTCVEFRPGAGCVANRLGLTLMSLVFSVPIFLALPPLGQGIPELVPGWRSREELALSVIGYTILLCGILAPLSAIWNRTQVRVDAGGTLSVSTFFLWPRTRSWRLTAFGGIAYGTRMRVIHPRRSRPRTSWQWFVRLNPAPMDNEGPSPSFVEFRVHSQTDPPEDDRRPPETVQALTAWLQHATGLPASGPERLGRQTGVIRSRYVTRTESVITNNVFTSYEELPEDLRAEVDRLRAEAREKGVPDDQPIVRRVNRFTIRSGLGPAKTYNSLEEMPPDVRVLYERMRQNSPEE